MVSATAPTEPRDLAAIVEGAAALAGERLGKLAELFGLDARELAYVKLCFAVAVEDSLGYPTERLAARLFEHGVHRVLLPESPLLRWEIIQEEPIAPGEPAALSLDPLIRDWLVGDNRLDAALVGTAALRQPLPPLPRWPVEELTARVSRLVRAGTRVRIRVVAPPGTGRRTFAACVASLLGMPLLVIDCQADLAGDDRWPRIFACAQRQAFLDTCAPAWIGDGALRRRWPPAAPPFPVQFLIDEAGDPPPAAPGFLDLTVELPAPSVAERIALWRTHVPGARDWPEAELTALAAQHRAGAGDLAAIGLRGVTTIEEAAVQVREAGRHRLGELAQWMECPFTWNDLVLPDALRGALHDLVFEASDRAAFWEAPAARRLFPQGQGLVALFSGAPGTGKTMSAQVIAAALRVDLFRISLASVVSKYVGETAKNLQKVLARAEAMDAVLLFDEADALFGTRTEIKDAHDRFANTDTDYLLQAIEAYRGVAVLATNRLSNIDAAFLRRLRYVLEFPRPEAPERRLLWGQLIEELAGERAADLSRDLDALALHIDVTGAQIKYAVLGALFAARQEGAPLAAAHLLRGLDRELQKEGRALSERDRERLRHG